MATSDDLPEAAERRLSEGSFSSGLSVSDFAACLDMGLEPVGLVQGFCAMQWSTYTMGGQLQRNIAPYGGSHGGYVENYQCPHGMISGEHRMWGQNYQQSWVESSWMQGFSSAYSRMIEEATQLGATGVVGILDTEEALVDRSIIEFHVRGTAVKLSDAPPSTAPPWTTFLAGQRLTKVIEAGYAPVSIVAALSSVRVWAYCITEYLMGGGGASMWSNNTSSVEIDQIVRAKSAARVLARTYVRDQLEGDALHGATLVATNREYESGDLEIQTVMRGNRIRRFKEFDALAAPLRTVRLS
jgi:uncharacterized protein YbjQ (UPF0145 family)